MSATLTLDRFELLWLFEGAVGKSHLRWDIYPMFVDKVYPQLSDDEREAIYTYAKRDSSWLFEGKYVDKTAAEYFKQMLARFNPSNQYVVTMKKGRAKQQKVDAYLFAGNYYISWQKLCAPEYIKRVEKKPYKTCTNDYCKSKTVCKRYLEHKEGNITLEGPLFRCDNCVMLINVEE